MDMELWNGLMVQAIKENGSKVKPLDSEDSFMLMVTSTSVHGMMIR
jgi:hypothetical protein